MLLVRRLGYSRPKIAKSKPRFDEKKGAFRKMFG